MKNNKKEFETGSVQIAIGTLGRVCHLMQDGYLDADSLNTLVIDEADKMIMDNSFRGDMKYVRFPYFLIYVCIFGSAIY